MRKFSDWKHMKSKTKNLLSDEQITHLVKANFGEKTEVGKIEELKGGMFNSAYRIERITPDDPIILKVSVRPGTPVLSYEKDLMRTEVEVYRMISEQTSIPVPKILCADFSKRIIDSDYFFMTALKGEVMTGIQKKLSKENLSTIKKNLGNYFAQIHRIKGPYFGYFTTDPSRQFASWKEAFLSMNRDILNDGKAHGVSLPYTRIENALEKTSSLLDAIREPTLVDYDLWTGNIFLIKNGDSYQIEGIVDFERAFWGDPYADFPPIFMVSEDIWKDPFFWSSYSDASTTKKEVTGDDQVRITLYKMYIWLIMAVETYRYGFLYGLLQKIYAKRVAMKYLKQLEMIL
jgi:aminoglycoside phosphotransferase (APT) family kinase protein